MQAHRTGRAWTRALPLVALLALPATAQTIPEVAERAGSFKTLTKALEVAGLSETLAGEGPFTVFAPTDEAFAKVPQADLQKLLQNRALLRTVLLNHVAKTKRSALCRSTRWPIET